MNRANTKVADLRDLVLSPDGEILYAILGYGGVGGVGETDTAAPFDAFQVRHVSRKWTVGIDRTAEAFKQAPTIQSRNYRELTDPQWVARADQFFRPRDESKADAARKAPPRLIGRRRPSSGSSWRARSAPQSSRTLSMRSWARLRTSCSIGWIESSSPSPGKGGVLSVGKEHIPDPLVEGGSQLQPGECRGDAVSIDATKAQSRQGPLIQGGQLRDPARSWIRGRSPSLLQDDRARYDVRRRRRNGDEPGGRRSAVGYRCNPGNVLGEPVGSPHPHRRPPPRPPDGAEGHRSRGGRCARGVPVGGVVGRRTC